MKVKNKESIMSGLMKIKLEELKVQGFLIPPFFSEEEFRLKHKTLEDKLRIYDPAYCSLESMSLSLEDVRDLAKKVKCKKITSVRQMPLEFRIAESRVGVVFQVLTIDPEEPKAILYFNIPIMQEGIVVYKIVCTTINPSNINIGELEGLIKYPPALSTAYAIKFVNETEREIL